MGLGENLGLVLGFLGRQLKDYEVDTVFCRTVFYNVLMTEPRGHIGGCWRLSASEFFFTNS